MDKLKIFKSNEFGKIEIYVDKNGKEWFPATEIAEILGYKNPRDAIAKHCKELGKIPVSQITTEGNRYNKIYIDEGNFYRLTARSNLPNAEKFEIWIFDDVIPTIRKTGGYGIQIPKTRKEALQIALELENENERLKGTLEIQEQLIEEHKPKLEYLDIILSSEDTIAISQIAADYGLSGKMLNKKLHEQGFIRKVNNQWILYKEYMNKGYTKSDTFVVKKEDGSDKVVANTKYTQKGRLKIHEILNSLGIMANLDKES